MLFSTSVKKSFSWNGYGYTEKGVTLIEILIAMFIFSIVATMGYSGLNNVISFQREQKRIQNTQEDLQRVLLIMARDFYQIVPRSVRDNNGSSLSAVHFDSNNNEIEFTRSGTSNAIIFNRSQFLRVGYSLEDGELYRKHWYHLDRAFSAVPQKNLMLRNVDSIRYEFLHDDKSWKKTWSSNKLEVMPIGIRMTLLLENGIEYLHSFPIVQVQ